MPVSRRVRKVALTQTKKKGADLKSNLVDRIRDCVDEFSFVYVYSFDNMRSSKFKNVRRDWEDSRFFLGKNKVMCVALGRSEEQAYREQLHSLADDLGGSVGLLFTNRPQEEVSKYFSSLSETDFARSGAVANETVTLDAGPISHSFSMTEQLRKLGMPVMLKTGVVELLENYTICRKGDVLTPEQAKLLKHFDIRLSTFKIQLVSMWCNERLHITGLEQEVRKITE